MAVITVKFDAKARRGEGAKEWGAAGSWLLGGNAVIYIESQRRKIRDGGLPMAEIINATANEAAGDWQNLGIVIGVAVEMYGSLEYASASALEQHGQRTRVARESALERMNAQAAKMGADAVVGIRFDSVVAQSSHAYASNQIVEYVAYGTAVKLR